YKGDADPNILDQYTFNLAGSYDCGVAKTFLAVQYFKDARDAASIMSDFGLFGMGNAGDQAYRKMTTAASGYGVHLSTQFDALGGTWKAGVGYMDGDVDYADQTKVADLKAYTLSLGYEYSLSKRTTLYSGAGYVKRELDIDFGHADNRGDWSDKAYTVQAGLVHRF
ncbi:MAG: porin, partial [Sutterella sp.]|nr:porin [Sutterella sp.]